MIDIVIPKGNEAEFIEMAEKLGYSELCFAYASGQAPKLPESKVKLYRAAIGKGKADLVIMDTSEPRHAIEKLKPDIICGLELSSKPDAMYFRNSGLSQVTAELAARKKVAVGYSFSEILGQRQHMVVGRMMQNIMLCSKYKVTQVIASFATDPLQMRNPRDLASLFTVLGMQNPLKALSAASQIIAKNKEKANPGYAGEGIKIERKIQ